MLMKQYNSIQNEQNDRKLDKNIQQQQGKNHNNQVKQQHLKYQKKENAEEQTVQQQQLKSENYTKQQLILSKITQSQSKNLSSSLKNSYQQQNPQFDHYEAIKGQQTSQNYTQPNIRQIKVLQGKELEDRIRETEERLKAHEKAHEELKHEISKQERKTKKLVEQMHVLKKQAESAANLRANKSSLISLSTKKGGLRHNQDQLQNENQEEAALDPEEFQRKLEQVRRELSKQTEVLNRLQSLHEEPLFRSVTELEVCILEEHPELASLINVGKLAKKQFASYKKEYMDTQVTRAIQNAQLKAERENFAIKQQLAKKQADQIEQAELQAKQAEEELQRILEGKERRRKMYEEALFELRKKKSEQLKKKAAFEAQRRQAIRDQERKTEDKMWTIKQDKQRQENQSQLESSMVSKSLTTKDLESNKAKVEQKQSNNDDSFNRSSLSNTGCMADTSTMRDEPQHSTMVHKATTLCLNDLLQKSQSLKKQQSSRKKEQSNDIRLQCNEVDIIPDDIDIYLETHVAIPDVIDRLFAQNQQRWKDMQTHIRSNWDTFNQQGTFISSSSKTKQKIDKSKPNIQKSLILKFQNIKLQTPDGYSKRPVITKPLQDIPVTSQGEIFPIQCDQQTEIETRRKQYMGRRDFVEIQLNYKQKVNKIFDEMQELQINIIKQDELNTKKSNKISISSKK